MRAALTGGGGRCCLRSLQALVGQGGPAERLLLDRPAAVRAGRPAQVRALARVPHEEAQARDAPARARGAQPPPPAPAQPVGPPTRSGRGTPPIWVRIRPPRDLLSWSRARDASYAVPRRSTEHLLLLHLGRAYFSWSRADGLLWASGCRMREAWREAAAGRVLARWALRAGGEATTLTARAAVTSTSPPAAACLGKVRERDGPC